MSKRSPLSKPSASTRSVGDPSGVQLRQKRLLLVEDDPALQRAYTRLLHRWNIVAVGTLRGAEEALRHSFDVVVLDLGLPDGDGRALRERLVGTPDLLLIVVSGEVEPHEAEAWERQGTRVFKKDTPWDALLRVMEEVPDDPDRGAATTDVALHVALDQLARERTLTRTEHAVLRLYVRGHSNRASGAKLKVTPGTIDRHLASVRRKFGVSSSAALMTLIAARALRDRL